MIPAAYHRPTDLGGVLAALVSEPTAKLIAGGTNLVDLMKEDVARPTRLLDLNLLPLREISERPGGGLRLGALATNADTAYEKLVAERYPLLAMAILSGASPQLRNMATNGGNLLQRTRCLYFYDVGTPCNKREPGSGCPARQGQNRMHAILGASEHCIAVHPSDMCVALAALDAVVSIEGPRGERTIPLTDFHRLPEGTPQLDTELAPDEVVVAIDLEPNELADHCDYLKLRDRTSYAFALVSVASALALDASGALTDARLALGGVAHKPWRDRAAERLLLGQKPSDALFEQVAATVMKDAVGHGHNDFKIELARRAIVRSLQRALRGRGDASRPQRSRP